MGPEWLPLLLQIAAPGGLAAVAVKVALNGRGKKIDEIHADVKVLKEASHDLDKRVTVLEAVKG